MLKKLNRREVGPDQREFAERAAHKCDCFLDCRVDPLCHSHPDHLVVQWIADQKNVDLEDPGF